mmetsp:Transcript_32306/g.74224  ORF Transcript_32306/g.74224 Transcript_32306/m.74224 type:complete len:287 (+) Transcript_32306:128-988(+)
MSLRLEMFFVVLLLLVRANPIGAQFPTESPKPSPTPSSQKPSESPKPSPTPSSNKPSESPSPTPLPSFFPTLPVPSNSPSSSPAPSPRPSEGIPTASSEPSESPKPTPMPSFFPTMPWPSTSPSVSLVPSTPLPTITPSSKPSVSQKPTESPRPSPTPSNFPTPKPTTLAQRFPPLMGSPSLNTNTDTSDSTAPEPSINKLPRGAIVGIVFVGFLFAILFIFFVYKAAQELKIRRSHQRGLAAADAVAVEGIDGPPPELFESLGSLGPPHGNSPRGNSEAMEDVFI